MNGQILTTILVFILSGVPPLTNQTENDVCNPTPPESQDQPAITCEKEETK